MSRVIFRPLYIFCLAVIALMPSGAAARGVTPYLPLNMSPEIERQIERVLILAGKPVMTRPIAVSTVSDALSDARKVDEGLAEQVASYLERYTGVADLTHLRAEISAAFGDSERYVPNQRGMKVDSSWQLSAEAYYRPFDYVLINLGGIAYEGYSTPAGSMLSLGMEYAQLDIGYRDHWLSPFTDSSMLISTEAPTMPSITLSNYRPISFLGLSYEMYLAEMSESNRILYEGRYTTGNPRLAALHLQIEPVAGFSLGGNRLFQYGGGERRNDSFRDLIHALFDGTKYDITGPSLTSDEQLGNEQASLTSRMLFPGRHPFAVYFEYAGDDFSKRHSFHLGNSSFSMGIDLPSLWDRFDLTYETTGWQNGLYVHGVYKDGLTNRGLVIGNWFGDQRKFDDDPGGMSHMLRVAWQAENGNYMQATYRTLTNDSYTSVPYKRMQELGLSYSFPWSGHAIGAQLYAGRDVFGDRYLRLSTSFNLGQDWLGIHSDSGSGSKVVDPDDSTGLLAGIGMNYSSYRSNIRNPDGELRYKRKKKENLHLGLGALHAITENSDLGVRIEWNRIEGYNLYSIRMMDYVYRIGKRVAVSGFFGVGRYDLEVPTYGYYAGGGAKWLNIIPKWDLCIDMRRHIELSRPKVIESESLSKNVFFNILNTTLYLDYHF